ncbi:MAG TPA: hypothetical protein VLL97_03600 [Acidobacteriota bacterium]|nr:hypothetical protein [Acidobacteriota bacterium]
MNEASLNLMRAPCISLRDKPPQMENPASRPGSRKARITVNY